MASSSRRRRPKVVWLPPDLTNRLNVAPAVANNPGDSGTLILTFTAPALGTTPSTETFPVVKDAGGGQDPTVADTTLADLTSSGYRLRRIVGKVNVSIAQDVAAVAADPTLYLVTLGFIILKTQGDGSSGPLLGAGDPRYSPSSIRGISDPWIWRRSWQLADRAGAAVLSRQLTAPISNMEYGGGNLDGPHIDAKTARTVGPDERLFGVITAEGLDGNGQAPNPGFGLLIGDLRVLATVTSNTGNRRNASR